VLRLAVLFPELLGTYGDAGNAAVLAARARRRGLDVEVAAVALGDDVPAADLYLLGGGEDGPQRLAADLLRASALTARVADGARVLAVCAGLQLLGETFCVEGDDEYPGIGLVAARTTRGASRSVGDLAVRVGDRLLVGFENHGGVTTLGPGVAPMGAVVRGHGNDGAVDGVRAPRLWATYAHGPALAQNPWLADEVLADLVGDELGPLATVADELHAARVASLGL
jgi:lipid II isoglutaminyl synthase (glutamine-hydrolysing)